MFKLPLVQVGRRRLCAGLGIAQQVVVSGRVWTTVIFVAAQFVANKTGNEASDNLGGGIFKHTPDAA